MGWRPFEDPTGAALKKHFFPLGIHFCADLWPEPAVGLQCGVVCYYILIFYKCHQMPKCFSCRMLFTLRRLQYILQVCFYVKEIQG